MGNEDGEDDPRPPALPYTSASTLGATRAGAPALVQGNAQQDRALLGEGYGSTSGDLALLVGHVCGCGPVREAVRPVPEGTAQASFTNTTPELKSLPIMGLGYHR